MALEEEVLTIAIELLQHAKSALDDAPMPTELTTAIEQLQHAKSALDDAPMPTYIPPDEFSEADALSFN